MAIVFVRHTPVKVDTGICYGQSDVSPVDNFKDYIPPLKKQLEKYTFNNVYSSPLVRCKMLALATVTDPIIFDDRLKELDFGDWELKSWDYIYNYCSFSKQWFADFVNEKVPDGESFLEQYNRVVEFLCSLNTSTDTLVFTHAGVIRCAYAYFNNVPLGDVFSKEVPYAEVVVF